MSGTSTDECVQIEEWRATHPQWPALLEIVAHAGQTDWFNAVSVYTWRTGDQALVALQDHAIVGFLRLVTQAVGADEELPPTLYNGEPLIEAKILAFGVVETHRRRGIGRALQAEAIGLARRLGCYQLKSHSGGESQANHRLKLAMGFAIHRIERGDDRHGAYFLMPLQERSR